MTVDEYKKVVISLQFANTTSLLNDNNFFLNFNFPNVYCHLWFVNNYCVSE